MACKSLPACPKGHTEVGVPPVFKRFFLPVGGVLYLSLQA